MSPAGRRLLVPAPLGRSPPCARRLWGHGRQGLPLLAKSCRAQGALLRMVAGGLVVLLLTACGGSRNAGPSARGGSSSSSGGRYDDIRKSQGSRYRSSSDSVPTAIPDVSKLPEPVPKVEPRSLYGNKSPYSVLGQTYNVLPSPHGYVERGIASFYG